MNEKIIRVAAVALVRDGRFFCQQRAADNRLCAGYWELPGGKVEPGETALQAAVRELKEEVAADVAEGDLQHLITVQNDWTDRGGKKIEADVFVCETWQGKPYGAEGQVTDWVRLEAWDDGRLWLPKCEEIFAALKNVVCG